MALKDSYVKIERTPEEQEYIRDTEMKREFLEEAGLEGASADYLRKQFLSAAEAVSAKQEEMENARSKKSRKEDWEEYVDAKRRWGRALHHSDLISHLRRLVSNLYVIDGAMRHKDGSIDLGLYIWDRTEVFKSESSVRTGGTVYLGYIQEGWNPEYEIDFVNDVGIATRKLRGWRTTLLNMICRRDAETYYPKSLFTEERALAEFGFPTQGETASNYRQRLYEFRNTSPERAKMNAEILAMARRFS